MKIISTFQINNREFVISEVEDVTPAIEYAADGFSVKAYHGCCVRCQKVDEILDAAIVSGDEVKQVVAESMPRWFAVLIPGREYSEDVMEIMLENWNRSYSWSALRFGGFYIEGERMLDVAMVRKGFDMTRMHLKLTGEEFKLHFNAEVRYARYKADQGVDIADLYRSRYL